MSAAEEAQHTCSQCGCAGPLHREDEVVRGCQLAELRTKIHLANKLAASVRRGLGHPSLDSDDERRTRDLLWAYLDFREIT